MLISEEMLVFPVIKTGTRKNWSTSNRCISVKNEVKNPEMLHLEVECIYNGCYDKFSPFVLQCLK